MSPFDKSRTDYPGLPAKILEFFDLENATRFNSGIQLKRIQDFIADYGAKNPGSKIQPNTVIQICHRLVAQGHLSETYTGGVMGLENRYVSIIEKGVISLQNISVIRLLDCVVYGIPAVYDHYASSVLPLINWNSKEGQQIGTCFVGGAHHVITALHCIKPASFFALRGVSIQQLEAASFYSHPNEALDLAIIIFPTPVFDSLPSIPMPREPAQILDEVMALGYPNVPGFHPTLAAESARVSARLSVTRGQVASMPTEIFSKAELFLITARVRGGFSGGPVLDPFGQSIGVISREPAADANPGEGQKYDDLGYGTAIPALSVVELMEAIHRNKIKACNMSGVKFREFT